MLWARRETEQMSRFFCRLLGRAFFLGAVCGVAASLVCAAEQSWELRGELIAIGADEPRLVELRLPDGSTAKVPLAAFSEASKTAILAVGAAGKPVPKAVVEGSRLAAIEEAVGRCKTAEDALRAMKLCLAGGAEGIPPADAAAAVARWEARAKRGEVRLGKEWVQPADAVAAREAGEELLKKLATMVGLGNYKSFREYLDRASKIDPNSGRADFLLGMAAAFGVSMRADTEKASKYFTEVIAREPENGAAWNNLAVCQALSRRFDDALLHFTKAAECLENPQVVVANVGFMAGARNLTAKQAEAFAAVYERLVPQQDGQRMAPPPLSGLNFLSPFDQPIAGQLNVADLFVAPPGNTLERVGGGIVVAPAVVLVPSEVLFSGGSLVVRSPAEPTVDRPAQVIATSQELGITLLRCDGLTTEPMALADAVSAVGSEAIVVPTAGRGRGATTPGKVIALDVLPGVFVHAAAGPSSVLGAPLVDTGGRVVGLTATTPQFNQPDSARAFGTPIERVWPFLKDHVPDLEPAEAPDAKKPWEKVASDASRRMVTVVARPAP